MGRTVRSIGEPGWHVPVAYFSIELLGPSAPEKSRVVFNIVTSAALLKGFDKIMFADLEACRISMEPTEGGPEGTLTARNLDFGISASNPRWRQREPYRLFDEDVLASFYYDIKIGRRLFEFTDALRGIGLQSKIRCDLTHFEFTQQSRGPQSMLYTSRDFMYANHTHS